MAVYRGEQEAPEKVSRLSGLADAWLFASPAPLEYCRSAGVISCPAVAIQLAGEPLLATLLAAARAGVDLTAVSFDTLTQAAVMQALSMLGIAADGVHVREQITSPASLASYHARLWRVGQTSAAVTCLDDVTRRLTGSQVPVFTVRPTGTAVASALELATLTAGRRVLAESQFAVALVEVPALREDGGRHASRLAHEEIRLTAQHFLVREAQRIDATVSRTSDCGFLVLGTRGSIAAAAASARSRPERVPPSAWTLRLEWVLAALSGRLRTGPGPGSGICGRPRRLAPAARLRTRNPPPRPSPAPAWPVHPQAALPARPQPNRTVTTRGDRGRPPTA